MYIQKELQCLFENKVFSLRCLHESDVSQGYVASLSQENRYLETKLGDVSISQQKKYISATVLTENRIIFGLFYQGNLIGSSGVQFTSSSEATAGIFLFDHFRGHSLGKVLVWMVCNLVSQEFPIQTLRAGMKIDNQASLKSFLTCGFSITETSDDYYFVGLDSKILKKPKGITMINSI